MSVPVADKLRSKGDNEGFCIDCGEPTWRGMHRRCDLVSAADLLDAIDALHQRNERAFGRPAVCRHCQYVWPCQTARLLHPEAGEA